MTLHDLRLTVIIPALTILPVKMTGRAAELQLLATTLQEDPKQRRRQWPTGPARGLWQFEQGGGVSGVLRHKNTRQYAVTLCDERNVRPVAELVHARLEHDDILAAGFARLLLWSDPLALPAPGEVEAGWQLYLRTWRPGAYSRGDDQEKAELRRRWSENYARAMDAMA
ncbi:hypothetical protein [Pseudomonas solani]|uniref:hypothetical protein n=1 Tax=Pseudomonas solani TaxID=2731552 RepID=UPI003D6B8E00